MTTISAGATAGETTHLEDYLAYYQTTTKPGYAVLVTGPWGSGKTFQVKAAIPEDQRLYVSLFGVQTVEQLHAEVMAAAFPTSEKLKATAAEIGKALSQLGGLFDFAGKAAAALGAAGVLGPMLRRKLKPEQTLIFDDLERSLLPTKDVLGAINTYVEHGGFRVVVIAHDDKLATDFVGMKEKTFGQVLRVAPQVAPALAVFLEHIPKGPARDFITAHQTVVMRIFEQSGEPSLRILRHVIEDLGRLFAGLTSRHLSHERAMREMVALFTVFDIETRRGALGAADLKRHDDAHIWAMLSAREGDDDKKLPLDKATQKYAGVFLDNKILNDELLESMFVHGRYDAQEIQSSFDNSAAFIKPAEEPAWKIISAFSQISDEVVDEATEKLGAEFDARSITDSGPMLHMFAIRLMLTTLPGSTSTIEDEAEACRRYVDDLFKSGALPPRETGTRWWDAFERSHDGYGYWTTPETKTHFCELWKYLVKAREDAFERQLPDVASRLLGLLTDDVEAFQQSISSEARGEFAHVPVFHAMDIERFIDAWLASPRSTWRSTFGVLEERWQAHRLERYLAPEALWASELQLRLRRRAEAETGLRRLRIEWLMMPDLIQPSGEPATAAAEVEIREIRDDVSRI